MSESRTEIPMGRRVSPKTLEKANELGFDFICLTGNPGTGVSNDAIAHSIKLSKEHFNGLVIAGKMHGAGVAEPVMTLEIARKFVDLGVDILLVPASCDSETIKKIGLAAKAAGADLQHIGDSMNGICLPQNIFTLGQALRGYRHQIVMLSRSVIR